jgi:hypothetical protein
VAFGGPGVGLLGLPGSTVGGAAAATTHGPQGAYGPGRPGAGDPPPEACSSTAADRDQPGSAARSRAGQLVPDPGGAPAAPACVRPPVALVGHHQWPDVPR